VLTYLVAPTAYNKGEIYRFFAHADNTGAATININGLGAKSLLSQRGEALSAGQIKTGDAVEAYFDGSSFRIISNEKHNAKLTGVLNITDSAPGLLLTNTSNTAANTNVRFGMVGNNAVLQVGAANTLTVSANNLTVAGSINTAGITSSAAISSTGSVTGAGLISTGGISATGNISLGTGGERQISFGDAGMYFYAHSTKMGLYYPAASKSPWYYNKTNDVVNFQTGSLQHNGTTVVTNSGGTYSISITGNAGGNAATATTATNANRLLLNGSGYTNFNWSGQGGQPTWLWGGNDAGNMYVYNPLNFSVNYATSAGNANTLGGLSNAYFMQRLVNTWLTDNEGGLRFYFNSGSGPTTIRSSGDPIVRFMNGNGTVAAHVRAGGTYENLSDRRTKYDIVDANDIGRDNLMALRPRWYKRIGIDKVELGWISQETREAISAAVNPINPDDPDELLYIDEKAISVATVATLQEVVVELETIKAELAALKPKTRKKAA
jgi:hypothetical protein